MGHIAPKETEHRIFCYGTLNVHEIQRQLWGEAKQGQTAHVRNYELKMWPSSTIFYIEKKVGESVPGKVYTLNDEQLKATDAYETAAYKRVRVSEPGDPLVEAYVINKDSGSQIGGLRRGGRRKSKG